MFDKKIFVPLDFSDCSLDALRFAAAVAHKINASLEVLHVVETYKYNSRIQKVLDYTEVLEKEVSERIDDFRTDNSILWGLKTNIHIANGKIYRKILEYADDLNPDIIVMGTQGASGINEMEKYFLGSNAYRVVYNANCPVITLRSAPKEIKFEKIILALDVDKATREKVDSIIQWGKALGAELCLTTVTESLDEMRSKADEINDKLNELAEIIKEEGILCGSKLIRNGEVTKSIINHAEEVGADMIAIMTTKENILTELFLGSTARRIIQHSTVPVLSTHPTRTK